MMDRLQYRVMACAMGLALLAVVAPPPGTIPWAHAAAASQRAFTVADSIEMRRIIDPRETSASRGMQPHFKWSPDGRRFVVVTRKGNMETGLNDYELWMYDVAAVTQSLATAGAPMPAHRVLLRLSSAVSEGGASLDAIRNVEWLPDGRSLAYIGQPQDAPGQVFVLDIDTGRSRQLTNHPTSVWSFDYDPVSDGVVYLAREVASTQRLPAALVVGSRSVNALLRVGDDDWGELRYFAVTGKAGAGTHRLDLTAVPAVAGAPHVAPGGRWASVTRSVLDIDTQRQWIDSYQALRDAQHLREAVANYDPDLVAPSPLFGQVVLIDLESGKSRPVLDAPDGSGVAGFSVGQHWLADGRTLILANVMLPITPGLSAAERTRRQTNAAVIAYDAQTGQYQHIADLPAMRPGYQWDQLYAGSEVDAQGRLRIKFNQADGRRTERVFARQGNGIWQEIETPAPASAARAAATTPSLQLSVRESADHPPELWAADRRTGRERAITDLNPQLRSLSLGRQEELQWQSAGGKTWRAGLVYPPDFKPGQRYPLVIQTHGYMPGEFLVDGPEATGSAFAAQALANQGMLVVQLGEQREGFDSRQELLSEEEGVASVVDLLDRRGILDRTRVGLIGWSSTGVTTLYNITFGRTPIAAATIADSFGLGLFNYVVQFGGVGRAMFQTEAKMGAVPWGDQRDTWVARDPAFNTDRIKTPLRLEQYADAKSVFGLWDIYALLKRRHKPVEYWLFPDGTHVLVKPRERYASQQGNVDWFRFWLKGEEDPDPAKAEQYARWRKLREQHERDLAAPTKQP